MGRPGRATPLFGPARAVRRDAALRRSGVEGRWLALLGWQAAALKCAARDAWIGWGRVLHYQRLHLIANNTRFLVLPAGRLPNLASRVLALNLRRLSGDWQQIHGHPLLLAETFVDPARFTGTCYRAANWQAVGRTRGFARRNGHYVALGQPKQVLLYPCTARPVRCCAPRCFPPAWSTPTQRVTLTTAQLEALQQRLRALPDCRHPGASAIAEWAACLTQAQLKRLRARHNAHTERFEPPSEPPQFHTVLLGTSALASGRTDTTLR
jgi:hypothetical protein